MATNERRKDGEGRYETAPTEASPEDVSRAIERVEEGEDEAEADDIVVGS